MSRLKDGLINQKRQYEEYIKFLKLQLLRYEAGLNTIEAKLSKINEIKE